MKDKDLRANLFEEKGTDMNASMKPNKFHDPLRVQDKVQNMKLQEGLNGLIQDI